jgi:hypothetical protein
VKKLPDDDTEVPKHFGEIKHSTIVFILCALAGLVKANKLN